MGPKRSYDDCSLSERSTPPTSTSTRNDHDTDIDAAQESGIKKPRLSLDSGSVSRIIPTNLSRRIEARLTRILQDAFIPRDPSEFQDFFLYQLQIARVRNELTTAMLSLKRESDSTFKPFQKAYSMSILPLKIDQARWGSIDPFYQIHLTRARSAYIRHIWKSSTKEHEDYSEGYVHDLVEYLPAVEGLLLVPNNTGVTLAYNLIFYLTGYLYIKTNLIRKHEENDELYAVIDAMLLRVIDRRLKADEEEDIDSGWVSEGLAKFNKASERFREHDVPQYLAASISRLREADDSASQPKGLG